MLALLNQEREKTATELQDRDTENQKLQKEINILKSDFLWQWRDQHSGDAQCYLAEICPVFPLNFAEFFPWKKPGTSRTKSGTSREESGEKC